jgi:hypothetical protein
MTVFYSLSYLSVLLAKDKSKRDKGCGKRN